MAELLRAVIAGGNMGKVESKSILSHSSIFSTTPFFPVSSLPRGGWFIPSRAWSFPPSPFSPWAVRSSRGRFICAHRKSCFSSHVGWDPHTERHSTLSSRTGALHWFFLTQGTGEIVDVTQDFRVQEPFLHFGTMFAIGEAISPHALVGILTQRDVLLSLHARELYVGFSSRRNG